MAHEALGALAGRGRAARGLLRLGQDLRGVALDERLRAQVGGEVGRGRAGPEVARVADLDRVAARASAPPPGGRPGRGRRGRRCARARRATVVGSSMRRGVAGTRAAASSRSVWIAPGTARVRACSGVSRTTRRPIGLSSRTTSPTSVIQLRVVIPPRRPSTRKAGTGRPAARTTSRAWTSRVMGALRRVAGSKTETCRVWPGLQPARGERPAGGSGRARAARRAPASPGARPRRCG